MASPYPSGTQQDESDERTAGGPINNNEIQPSVFLREMNFHFMALLGEKTMQGQFHKPAERLGAIATSRAKVAERLSRSKLCVTRPPIPLLLLIDAHIHALQYFLYVV